MIATDLCKQQSLDADPKVYNILILLLNLDWAGATVILEEIKENILDLSQGAVRIL